MKSEILVSDTFASSEIFHIAEVHFVTQDYPQYFRLSGLNEGSVQLTDYSLKELIDLLVAFQNRKDTRTNENS